MRKVSLVIALILGSSVILPSYVSAASPTAGAACAKAGLSSSTATKKFTCIKSGKKLIWDKGVAIVKPATPTGPTPNQSAASAPAPAPTKAPLKTLIPIPLPVPQGGAVTFENAAANYAQIPQVAWQRVQDAIAANSSDNIPTNIVIGPNTKASLDLITSSINKEYKLFSGFQHFPSYTGVVSNAADEKWAEAQSATLFSQLGIQSGFTRAENISRILQGNCEMNGSTAVNCSGGMAINFKDAGRSEGFTYYSVETGGPDFWTVANKNAGPMTQVNHELTHNYQFAQFINKPFANGEHTAADQSHNFTPWWYSEGQANAIGISVFIDNVNDYTQVRKNTLTRSPGSNANIPAFTPQGMKSFLMDYQETGPQNRNWQMAYSIGYAAVEALVAIGGPQSTLALYALGGNGEDWETAFNHVYGITWDQGATILGQVLSAEYSALPMQR